MSSPASSIKRKLQSRLEGPERCHTLDDLLERLEAAEQRRQVRLRFPTSNVPSAQNLARARPIGRSARLTRPDAPCRPS